MQSTIKSALIHFGIAIAIAVSIVALADVTTLLPIDIGWHLLTFLYVLTTIGQVSFYYLTTYTNVGLTILSFILNYIIWVVQQVNLERTFHGSIFYKDNDFGYGVIVLSGLLWAINKLIIDRMFISVKVNLSSTNRLERLWTEKQST